MNKSSQDARCNLQGHVRLINSAVKGSPQVNVVSVDGQYKADHDHGLHS